jgi:hypothetical protein
VGKFNKAIIKIKSFYNADIVAFLNLSFIFLNIAILEFYCEQYGFVLYYLFLGILNVILYFKLLTIPKKEFQNEKSN